MPRVRAPRSTRRRGRTSTRGTGTRSAPTSRRTAPGTRGAGTSARARRACAGVGDEQPTLGHVGGGAGRVVARAGPGSIGPPPLDAGERPQRLVHGPAGRDQRAACRRPSSRCAGTGVDVVVMGASPRARRTSGSTGRRSCHPGPRKNVPMTVRHDGDSSRPGEHDDGDLALAGDGRRVAVDVGQQHQRRAPRRSGRGCRRPADRSGVSSSCSPAKYHGALAGSGVRFGLARPRSGAANARRARAPSRRPRARRRRGGRAGAAR